MLLGGWLIAIAAAASAVLLWKSYGGSGVSAGAARRVAIGHMLERGADDRACGGRGVADGASVDRRDPDAERDGRHVDRQFLRRRAGRRVGARRRATRRRRWWRSSSTGWCGSTSLLVALGAVVARPGLAAIWLRLGHAGAGARYESVAPRRARGGRRLRLHVSCAAELGPVGEPRAIRFPRRTSGAARRSSAPLRIEAHLAPEDPRRVGSRASARSRNCGA